MLRFRVWMKKWSECGSCDASFEIKLHIEILISIRVEVKLRMMPRAGFGFNCVGVVVRDLLGLGLRLREKEWVKIRNEKQVGILRTNFKRAQ